jgi:uncharacterized UBP type Zn finger protein
MNSVFQLLFHLPKFLLDLQESARLLDESLCSVTRALLSLYALSQKSPAAVSPHAFLSVWECCVPVLPVDRQQDAAEFIQILAEQVQRELSPYLRSSANRFSRTLMLQHDPFTKNFAFSLMVRIECNHCRDVRTEWQSSYALMIPITNSVEVSMQSLFQLQRVEVQCEKCKAKGATLSFSFVRIPRVMILQLQRFTGRGSGKDQRAMKIPDVLDIAPYVDRDVCSPPVPFSGRRGRVLEDTIEFSAQADAAPEFFEFSVSEDEKFERRRPGQKTKYDLISVLLHDGATVSSGHFRTAIRERISWRIYDDVRTSVGTFDPSIVYCAVYSIAQ